GTETALTSDSYDHQYPQWSPDGNWIVYRKDDATSYEQIYKVPSAGGTETYLTSDSYDHYLPQWSPGGNWIVYYKYDATGYHQIYKISSVGIEEIPSSMPDFFSFKVRPTITLPNGVVINYGIKREGKVSLRIYDIAGKFVKELLNRNIEPGNYTISWDGSNHEGKKVCSGCYFVRIESGKFTRAEKVMVIR
ncbi:T9SS type A sorting domain-containing protein, partial [candidate division WOR-3 bacterium]|nr:T9SS type A sorting domain-containing protein [candidate division WOR-3 bacterium]